MTYGTSMWTVRRRMQMDLEFKQRCHTAKESVCDRMLHTLVKVTETSALDFAVIAAANSYVGHHAKFKEAARKRQALKNAPKGSGMALAAVIPQVMEVLRKYCPESRRDEMIRDLTELAVKLEQAEASDEEVK